MVPMQDMRRFIDVLFLADITSLFWYMLTAIYFQWITAYKSILMELQGVAHSALWSWNSTRNSSKSWHLHLHHSSWMLIPICGCHFSHVKPQGRGTRVFLEHLDGVHPCIQFMIEKEIDDHDVLVLRKASGSLGHRMYRKPMHNNDRYLHKMSNVHPPRQKLAVVKTLLN